MERRQKHDCLLHRQTGPTQVGEVVNSETLRYTGGTGGEWEWSRGCSIFERKSEIWVKVWGNGAGTWTRSHGRGRHFLSEPNELDSTQDFPISFPFPGRKVGWLGRGLRLESATKTETDRNRDDNYLYFITTGRRQSQNGLYGHSKF